MGRGHMFQELTSKEARLLGKCACEMLCSTHTTVNIRQVWLH
jgi:hypothetical protein